MRFNSKILMKANNKFLVALSMGSDSVAIAHFLKTNYPTNRQISGFHFNHKLRPQNDEMENKAKIFCRDFDIPLICSQREVLSNDQQENLSESSLRLLRYKAMAGLGTVITGHHLDDACENYLYNCFNGVPEYLPLPVETNYTDFELQVIRPFILTTKNDINEYIQEHNLQDYVEEDETNRDEKYRRNWLRHNIIPQINNKGYNLRTVVRKRYEKYLKEL